MARTVVAPAAAAAEASTVPLDHKRKLEELATESPEPADPKPKTPADTSAKPNADKNVHDAAEDGSPDHAKRPKLDEIESNVFGKIETRPKSKITWRISNFSQLTGNEKLYSDTFIAGDCLWRLLLFPKGNSFTNDLSIKLVVADSTELPNGWSRYAMFSLAVINQYFKKRTVTQEFQHEFRGREESDRGWSWTYFAPQRDITNPAKKYLMWDTLIVECEILVLRAVHCSKVESEKEEMKLNPKAPVLAVKAPPNQSPLTTDSLKRTKGASEPTAITSAQQVEQPVLPLVPPIIDGTKILSIDPASEPVKSSADVQTICKGLITELSSRKRILKRVLSKDISGPSQTSSSDIQQRQKEALQGFFNMSLEAVQQANCFVNIEGILHTLIQHTDNLQEMTILEDIMLRLAEFKESIPHAKAVVETAQARRASLASRTADVDTKLEQRQKELSSLESEISTLSEEEAKLEAEVQRLMAQKEEVVTQKKSVSYKLERANEETCKDIEEWRSLEREVKKANGECLAGKETLASANVRWKLFREELGLGNLNIS